MPASPFASDERLLALFHQPRAQLIRQADAHTMAVQAWLASRSPDAEWLECAGAKAVSTGMKVRLFNQALGFNFPPELTEGEVCDAISRVRAFYEMRGRPWLWWIGPNPSPQNAHALMQGAGFDMPGALPCMIAPIHADSAPPASSFTVWRVSSRADLIAASRIRHAAFRFPAGEGTTYFEDMAESWLDEDGPASLYLAGPDRDTPLGMGAVIWGAGLPGIYIMATHPEGGRKGVGTAVLHHLLDHIRAEPEKPASAVLTASRFGFPLYARIGFEYLFDYRVYSPDIRN